MFEVDQPSGDSLHVPALHTLAEYMRLVPSHTPTYSSEPDTMPFREWAMVTLGWMQSYQVPDRYRPCYAAPRYTIGIIEKSYWDLNAIGMHL